MIYANGGMGKSWLGFGIAKYAAQHNMHVIYLDYDNPISVLKDRGIEASLINAYHNVSYSHRSKAKLQPIEMLEAFEQMAVGNQYSNTLFILDSLRNFCEVKSDVSAMRASDKLMNLREAGATIVVLHHSTKNGSNYEGSNNLRNSIDNMFRLIQSESPDGEIRWLLEVEKERAAITDTGLSINVDDLTLTTVDVETVQLNREEKDFIEQVEVVLSQHDKINKTKLLEAIGHKKDDKTARDRLDRFDGVHWKSEKAKGIYTYSLA
ncbi:hypothetical protein [Methylophaga nitratireducenticrescens]|nr:hypothetical protein [Methylophaga nitratireducenticrescens]AUZ85801.1 hypothetical protein CDW43_15060 [Methylophaga nitratireducenticrescens]